VCCGGVGVGWGWSGESARGGRRRPGGTCSLGGAVAGSGAGRVPPAALHVRAGLAWHGGGWHEGRSGGGGGGGSRGGGVWVWLGGGVGCWGCQNSSARVVGGRGVLPHGGGGGGAGRLRDGPRRFRTGCVRGVNVRGRRFFLDRVVVERGDCRTLGMGGRWAPLRVESGLGRGGDHQAWGLRGGIRPGRWGRSALRA